MIPSVNDDLQNDFEIEKQPTKTYKLNSVDLKIAGFFDGLGAMEQAIYIMLNTERYEYVIFSWNYGVELADLFGEPLEFVYPELKRRISEALLQDDRITGVDGFSFSAYKGKVHVTFTAHTIEGAIEVEKVVNI